MRVGWKGGRMVAVPRKAGAPMCGVRGFGVRVLQNMYARCVFANSSLGDCGLGVPICTLCKDAQGVFFFPWMFFTLASSVVGSLVSVLLILMSISSLSSCSQKAGRRHKSQRKRQREAVKESTLGPYSPNGCLQIANTHHPCIFKNGRLVHGEGVHDMYLYAAPAKHQTHEFVLGLGS